MYQRAFADVSGSISVHIALQRIQRLSGRYTSLNWDQFSAFLVSAIFHLNMASGFLLTESHIPSIATRKGWGGVFLWVTEKHCLRNGNTALIVIQPLFLLLFSVKYNKNIVGKYIVNYLQWKGYTIHWQGFWGMEQRVATLSCLSVYVSKTAESQIKKQSTRMWNAKRQLSIWKTSQMDKKMAKTIMTTAAVWVKHSGTEREMS